MEDPTIKRDAISKRQHVCTDATAEFHIACTVTHLCCFSHALMKRRCARTRWWVMTWCGASAEARRSASLQVRALQLSSSPLVGANTDCVARRERIQPHVLPPCLAYTKDHLVWLLHCSRAQQIKALKASVSGIAGEMVVGPKNTLFLDEISTGLDSSTTFLIVRCMRNFVHTLQARLLTHHDRGLPHAVPCTV